MGGRTRAEVEARVAEGVAHHRAGRLSEAAAAYGAALRLDPEQVDALQLLGLVAHRMGHDDDALALFDRAIALDRRHPAALANRALVHMGRDRLDEAADGLCKALKLRPDLGEAWLNLARVEVRRGRIDAATEALGRARTLRPHDPDIDAVAAGIALLDDPVRSLAHALVHGGGRAAAVALADRLLVAAESPAGIEDALLAAFAIDGVDHQRLDRATQAALAEVRDDPARLLGHPLAVAWLPRVLAHGEGWEQALVRARRWALDEVLAGRDVPVDGVAALAVQAYHTEYVWEQPENEVARLDALDPDREVSAAVRLAYGEPPDGWRPPEGWRNGPLAALLRVALDEPAEERALAAEIAALDSGDDPTSASVRALYEDNPYPRLVGVQVRTPIPLARAVAAALPGVSEAELPQGAVSVLVAGGGTGQHPLTSAVTWECTVTSVDLSLRSLARAARVARRLGVHNVAFRRGDLLKLDALPGLYDVVESVGVLHHLDDPWAGWAALRRKVRPGGLMRVGVYAGRARADVAAVHEVFGGSRPRTTVEVRAARQRILALPADHPARSVTRSPDWPSVTGCRDLLFHPREHVTDLPRIGRALAALDLELLGLQHLGDAPRAAYRARWPEDTGQRDLDRWDALEADDPRLFTGMYVVWARAGAGDSRT